MAKDISKLTDQQKNQLISNRWASSYDVWDVVDKIYRQNTAIYKNEAEWLNIIPAPRRKYRVQANRVFVNMEAVINSLIANPPGINVLPARKSEEAKEFSIDIENYLRKKYQDLNVKEVLRMGLRNLYFGRLIIFKPFWNNAINDFDVRAIDPRKVRFGRYARKEPDTEFAIEEIDDNLCSIIERFPSKKEELMKKYGFTNESELYIKNPDVKYKEAWIGNMVIFQLENIILDTIRNPYWDWDGILLNEEEYAELNPDDENTEVSIERRRQILQGAKLQQEQRQAQTAPVEGAEYVPPSPGAVDPNIADAPNYKPYFFNFFDNPRKPYIFATIFNNENTPIGKTDMITLSAELQRGIDKRKMDIDENCEMVNGILKVDSTVMNKQDAQRIRYETKGVIYGKGVTNNVTRDFGQGLPAMVFEDMQDSRTEIDNIMAATSAFRGEREGQETKAGRLALIQQSYLRLNELVQVVDYVSQELFAWFLQLAKTRYTEYHYAKWMGTDDAQKVIELIQDDFETGSEITIIPGKTLPRDDEFKFEQAQNDVQNGLISPADYLEIAQYDNAKELAKNKVLYEQNPAEAVGLTSGQVPVPFKPGTPTLDQFAQSMPPEVPIQ